MSRKRDEGLLWRFEYPPYRIVSMGMGADGGRDALVAVAGGGGAARTGVPNRLELLAVAEVPGDQREAVPIVRRLGSLDRDTTAIMAMRAHHNYVVAAEGARLTEFVFCADQGDLGTLGAPADTIEAIETVARDTGTQETPETHVRQRRADYSSEAAARDSTAEDAATVARDTLERSEARWRLLVHRQVDQCFPGDSVEVSAVAYSDKSGHLVVAAGTSGAVRVFERYSDRRPMELVLQREFADVSSAGLPVTDIDISPSQDEIVTVAGKPDWRYARVWSISRGVKVTELALVSPPGRHVSFDGTYRFRHCRYARVFGARPAFVLYATHVPTANKRAPSYMSVWGPLDPACGTDYQLIDVIGLGNNRAGLGSPGGRMIPTALCASPCGLLAAIGANEGRVCVYRLDPESHRLSLLYNLYRAHSFVVTDVTFLGSSRALRTGHQMELLSVGIDNMLRYHRLPHTPTYLRLERLYRLLSLLLVIFFCDRILLLLSLF